MVQTALSEKTLSLPCDLSSVECNLLLSVGASGGHKGKHQRRVGTSMLQVIWTLDLLKAPFAS